MIVRALYLPALMIGAWFFARELGFGDLAGIAIGTVSIVIAAFVNELIGVGE